MEKVIGEEGGGGWGEADILLYFSLGCMDAWVVDGMRRRVDRWGRDEHEKSRLSRCEEAQRVR